MFHQTANDTHAPLAGRLHEVTRALGVTRAFNVTRLKGLALFAFALGVILTGAQTARASSRSRPARKQ